MFRATAAVEKLYPSKKLRHRKAKSNNNDLLYSEGESDSCSNSDNDAVSEASEVDVANALVRLKKLDQELLSDSNEWAERGAAAGSSSSAWESDASELAGIHRECLRPIIYSPRYQVAVPATTGSYRHALSPFSTGVGPRPKTTPTSLQNMTPAISSRTDTSRWLFGGQRPMFSGQR